MAAMIGGVKARRDDDLLDLIRVLLLVQAGILLATTIEAAIWGAAFGAGLGPAFLSGAAAVALIVARSRIAPDHRWARRVVSVIEGVLIATLIIDSILALVIRSAIPPLVALLTRLALPLAVIVLLRVTRRPVPLPIGATA